jgi:Tat protein secretion system quality control protein TatD with DNase activity
MERTTILDNWMEDLDDKLNTTNVIAIGECGLDSTDQKTDITKHLKYFEKQIVLAARKRLSLVVHCRGARRLDEQCLNSRTGILPKNFRYTDTASTENQIRITNRKPVFLTVNLECPRYEKYPVFRSLICQVQLEDLIMETDTPHLHTSAEKFGSPGLPVFSRAVLMT